MGTSPSKGGPVSPNGILVVTERPSYVGGEVMNGAVHLRVVEAVASDGALANLSCDLL